MGDAPFLSTPLISTTSLRPAHADSAPSSPASQSEKELKNTPAGRKLLKAAQEFEANLLSSWWEEAEKDLKDPLGGDELGSGFDGLKGMAMNTMAMSMVKAGGVGISRMIFHSFEPALRRKLDEQNDPMGPGDGGQNQTSQTSASRTGG